MRACAERNENAAGWSVFPLSPGTSFFSTLSDVYLKQSHGRGIGLSDICVCFICTLCSCLNGFQLLELHLGTPVTFLLSRNSVCVSEDGTQGGSHTILMYLLLELFPLNFSEIILQIESEPSKEKGKTLNAGQWLREEAFLHYPTVSTGFILHFCEGCVAVNGPSLRLWLLSRSVAVQVVFPTAPGVRVRSDSVLLDWNRLMSIF